MKWDSLISLFREADNNGARRRLYLGCAGILRGSTWGQFAKLGEGFSDDDISKMADSITEFITCLSEGVSDNDVRLSGDCFLIGSIFNPYDFAGRSSEDILNESIYLSPKKISAMELSEIENQATAALLFRYRYCYLKQEFFGVHAISQWIGLLTAKTKAPVAACVIRHLLDSLDATRGSVECMIKARTGSPPS